MRMDYSSIVCVLGYIVLGVVKPVAPNNGYLVVSPSIFRPGSKEVISVTILQPSRPVFVEAKLFNKQGKLVAEAAHEIFGKGTLSLTVPHGTKGRCNLKICGNCVSQKDGSYTFHNSTFIIVKEKGTSVFIQTDRPVYKPSQEVQINIITTGPDLLPVDEDTLVYIEDPRRSRMGQWTNLKPICCGITNITYLLSDQPLLGTWTVVAQVQGHTYNKSFEIQKYALPKFEVFIEPPGFIKDWKKCEPFYVRARYTYGKRVHGNATVTVTLHGKDYYKEYKGLSFTRTTKIYGVEAFNVCVSNLISSDHWHDWRASKQNRHFRGVVYIHASVTSEAGDTVEATDNTCPISQHLIDLEFSRETRKHFKPGLPFRGKILVSYPDGTPANNVTVRVKADVNGQYFSTSDLISSNGQITYNISPLPMSAYSVWLEAEVKLLDGEAVHGMYYPIYKPLSSWYSPSKCHLMVESNTDSFKVGEEVKFRVLSTCPCNFTMFYEVVARGNIIHSGIHFARHINKRHAHSPASSSIRFEQVKGETKVDQKVRSMKICTISVKLRVSHSMAPVSRLVVYYVRPTGEGVADAIMFNVQPAFLNKVSIDASSREISPGDKLQMLISTRPNSCVCVGAVDKSVYMLKPNFPLSIDKIFEELETYDVTVDQSEAFGWRWSRGIRNKRSAFLWHTTRARDAEYAFEESGLIFMSDSVRLNYKQNVGKYYHPSIGGHRSRYGYQHTAAISLANSHSLKRAWQRKRTFFPETWIWRCYNTSSTKKTESLKVEVPDSITTWRVDALSLSTKYGLAVAQPIQIKTFKHFFIDFNLPYSVIRGEQVRIPLTVHNYIGFCLKAYVKIKLPSGVRFVMADQNKQEIRTCVGTDETKTVSVILVFTNLTTHKIAAEAEAYADSRCCSGAVNRSPRDNKVIAFDFIQREVLCEPEGLPKFYTHSVFFCPDERIHLSTPNKYEFQYLKKPEDISELTFEAKANNDVRIALSTEPKDTDNMYVIVLGGWSNTQSWIANGKEEDKLVSVPTKKIVSADEFHTFWVCWNNNDIEVGRIELTKNRTIMTARINDSMSVNYVGFSTGWGSEGQFKVWRKKGYGDSYSEVFNLGIPQNYIQGSQRAVARVTADVMGPTLDNLHRLIRLPYGCGEQNMIHFAPNVFVLRYLHTTNQLTDTVKENAQQYMMQGYQRQLTYRRIDGSYSAFGDKDSSGSIWLTSFVLKAFCEAKDYTYIDSKEITRSRDWIISQQLLDGSFHSTGKVINKELQGGIHGKTSLVAYVVTALLKSGTPSQKLKTSIAKAKEFLESRAHAVSSPYEAALTAYTLSLLGSGQALNALRKLNQMAIKKDGLMFWRIDGQTDESKHHQRDNLVMSAEVEISAYALLTYTTRGDIASSLPIVKWLSQQRNSIGGFLSTQDTCVALEALAEYAALTYIGGMNLTVSLASTNMDLQHKFVLGKDNNDLLQTADIPTLPTGLFVNAQGEGCALFQIDVNYNIPDPSKQPAFKLDVRLWEHRKRQKKNHTRDKRSLISNVIPNEMKVTIETCFKWLYKGSSNMAVVDVSLFTGFRPDETSLDKLLQQVQLRLKRYDIQARKVIFYFDEIRSDCLTCLRFEAYQEYTVGLTQPVPVKVYDYYEPGYEASQFYNVSHLSILSQELCDSDKCNEIEENIILPPEKDDCNSIFGCYDKRIESEELCTCHKDCKQTASPVCGSDGIIYPNLCRMEVQACHTAVHLDARPMTECQRKDEGSGDGSGTDLTSGEAPMYWEYNDTNTVELNVSADFNATFLSSEDSWSTTENKSTTVTSSNELLATTATTGPTEAQTTVSQKEDLLPEEMIQNNETLQDENAGSTSTPEDARDTSEETMMDPSALNATEAPDATSTGDNSSTPTQNVLPNTTQGEKSYTKDELYLGTTVSEEAKNLLDIGNVLSGVENASFPLIAEHNVSQTLTSIQNSTNLLNTSLDNATADVGSRKGEHGPLINETNMFDIQAENVSESEGNGTGEYDNYDTTSSDKGNFTDLGLNSSQESPWSKLPQLPITPSPTDMDNNISEQRQTIVSSTTKAQETNSAATSSPTTKLHQGNYTAPTQHTDNGLDEDIIEHRSEG